jgi:hypothetical protein
MLAQDSDKIAEAAEFMVSVERQDRDLAIRAMKVLVDSDQLRIGELDPSVAAVVKRFTALISDVADRIAGGSPALRSLATSPEEGLGLMSTSFRPERLLVAEAPSQVPQGELLSLIVRITEEGSGVYPGAAIASLMRLGAVGGTGVPPRLLRLPAGTLAAGCGGGLPAAVLALPVGDRFGHCGLLGCMVTLLLC